jgi:hypothetical protein
VAVEGLAGATALPADGLRDPAIGPGFDPAGVVLVAAGGAADEGGVVLEAAGGDADEVAVALPDWLPVAGRVDAGRAAEVCERLFAPDVAVLGRGELS